MHKINNLIRYVEVKGWAGTIYDLHMLFSCVCVLFFMLWYRRKYNVSLKHFWLTMLVLYPVGYIWMLVYTWIDGGFQRWGGGNIVRVFVYYPVFLYPVSRITKIRLRKLLDYISPGLALLQAIDHIMCVFPGCCHGYPAAWGIWNKRVQDYLFPNQWLESLTSFLICFYLLREAGKHNYDGSGKLYCAFLILFGGSRFLLEFLRDNDKLFWGISDLALHAAFMVVIGIFIYHNLKKH